MKTIILSVLLTCGVFCKPVHATIRYVKADATGANNGTSWADAYTNLQSATSDTIWIAAGTYKPTSGNDPNIYFSLGNKRVFGGFAGTETQLSQRDWVANPTILSGDIGVAGDTTDNSNRVVYIAPGDGILTLIDGLIIEKASSWSTVITIIPNQSYVVTVNNCIFRDNKGTAGAAINASSHGTLRLNNCTFERNSVTGKGGAIWLNGPSFPAGFSQAIIKDSRFYNNSAGESGGALQLGGLAWGSFDIDRCIFSGNSAPAGGVISTLGGFNTLPSVFMRNSVFAGNTSQTYSVANPERSIWFYNCTLTDNKSANGTVTGLPANSKIINSIIWNNRDSTGIASGNTLTPNSINPGTVSIIHSFIQDTALLAIYPSAYSSDPVFVNPATTITQPFNFADYNYRLDTSSPAINQGLDSFVATTSFDLDSMTRIFGAHVDLGCYEHQYCSFSLSGNILASTDTFYCNGDSVLLTAPSGGFSYNWLQGGTAESSTVYAPGIYKVSVTDSQNCLAQFEKEIVDQRPELTVTGATNLCGLTSTMLTANIPNAATYLWSDGITTADNLITTAGSYFVTAADSRGCSLTTDTFLVKFNPVPHPIITFDGTFLRTSNTYLLYEWLKEIPAGSGNYLVISWPSLPHYPPGSEAGSYKVRILSVDSCEGTSEAFVYPPLSIEDLKADKRMDLYPNPTNDVLNVVLPEDNGSCTYSIYDILGRAVVNQVKANITHQQMAIKLPQQITAGTYTLQVHVRDHVCTARFVVVK